MILSWVGFIACLVGLFYGGFGYDNLFSYLFLSINVILTIFLTVLYVRVQIETKNYKKQIFYAKKLLELREGAVLDFYKRYGIEPMYQNGKIMTPDELLKIATKIDEFGNLDQSIYEILGIDPILDKNGNEIPIVLVLKHLIKKLKQEGLQEVAKKFKGFYLKGSKKEKKQEAKKQAEKKAEKSGKEKKAKKEKKLKYIPGAQEEKKIDKGKKEKKGSKGDKNKAPEKEQPKAQEKQEKQESKQEVKPRVEKVFSESKQNKMETISNMFSGGSIPRQRKQERQESSEKSGYGEFTFE